MARQEGYSKIRRAQNMLTRRLLKELGIGIDGISNMLHLGLLLRDPSLSVPNNVPLGFSVLAMEGLPDGDWMDRFVQEQFGVSGVSGPNQDQLRFSDAVQLQPDWDFVREEVTVDGKTGKMPLRVSRPNHKIGEDTVAAHLKRECDRVLYQAGFAQLPNSTLLMSGGMVGSLVSARVQVVSGVHKELGEIVVEDCPTWFDERYLRDGVFPLLTSGLLVLFTSPGEAWNVVGGTSHIMKDSDHKKMLETEYLQLLRLYCELRRMDIRIPAYAFLNVSGLNDEQGYQKFAAMLLKMMEVVNQ